MLKRILDTLDGLDEGLKGHYAQGDNGKWHLQADDALELKSALEKEKDLHSALKAKVKALDAEMEDYRKSKAESAKRDEESAKKLEDDAKTRKDYEGLLSVHEQIKKKHRDEVKALTARIEAAERRNEDLFKSDQINAAIAKAKGVPELALIIRDQVRVEDRGGEMRLVVVGTDGKPRVRDGAGEPFTIDDLMAETRANQRLAGLFLGTGATGAGSPPSTGGGASQSARARLDALKQKQAAGPLNRAEALEAVALGWQTATAKTN
jgi:hypothetical protein